MTTKNKKITRFLLYISYTLIIAFLLFGLSNLYAFLNTGADRNNMFHVDLQKYNQYQPKVNWKPHNNKGREMTRQVEKDLQEDYLNAWLTQNIAYRSNDKNQVNDYYTKDVRKNIWDFVDYNTRQKVTVQSISLEHTIAITFFSEDGKLIALTDEVVEYKRMYQENQLIQVVREKNTYDMILLLEDGFWRIRHKVKRQSDALPELEIEGEVDTLKLEIAKIKGINYYPKDSPWDMYGEKFDAEVIHKDFVIIREAGLNTLRIFVPYEDFGKADVQSDKLEKLTQVLDKAGANDLKVIITLFDFYSNYDVFDWTLTQRHAEQVVSHVKDHPALLAWDIKNEADLDFKNRGEELVTEWLKVTIDLVRSLDNETPITIGWSNTKAADHLSEFVDFISFHYYEDLADFEEKYTALKTRNPNKSIVLGEFGVSSDKGIYNPLGYSEKGQAKFHKQMQELFVKNKVAFLSWTLYDFEEVPNAVAGSRPWRKNKQKHFGFIDVQGNKKPAFSFLAKP